MKRRDITLPTVFILLLFLDQVTKIMALKSFTQQFDVLPFLSFYLSFNHGISFGLFNSALQNQIVFIVLSLMIVIGLLWTIYTSKQSKMLQNLPPVMIISGAVGNIIDRIRIGAVVDFIYFHWKQYYFPIFNIADSVICIGCLMMFLMSSSTAEA